MQCEERILFKCPLHSLLRYALNNNIVTLLPFQLLIDVLKWLSTVNIRFCFFLLQVFIKARSMPHVF